MSQQTLVSPTRDHFSVFRLPLHTNGSGNFTYSNLEPENVARLNHTWRKKGFCSIDGLSDQPVTYKSNKKPIRITLELTLDNLSKVINESLNQNSRYIATVQTREYNAVLFTLPSVLHSLKGRRPVLFVVPDSDSALMYTKLLHQRDYNAYRFRGHDAALPPASVVVVTLFECMSLAGVCENLYSDCHAVILVEAQLATPAMIAFKTTSLKFFSDRYVYYCSPAFTGRRVSTIVSGFGEFPFVPPSQWGCVDAPMAPWSPARLRGRSLFLLRSLDDVEDAKRYFMSFEWETDHRPLIYAVDHNINATQLYTMSCKANAYPGIVIVIADSWHERLVTFSFTSVYDCGMTEANGIDLVLREGERTYRCLTMPEIARRAQLAITQSGYVCSLPSGGPSVLDLYDQQVDYLLFVYLANFRVKSTEISSVESSMLLQPMSYAALQKISQCFLPAYVAAEYFDRSGGVYAAFINGFSCLMTAGTVLKPSSDTLPPIYFDVWKDYVPEVNHNGPRKLPFLEDGLVHTVLDYLNQVAGFSTPDDVALWRDPLPHNESYFSLSTDDELGDDRLHSPLTKLERVLSRSASISSRTCGRTKSISSLVPKRSSSLQPRSSASVNNSREYDRVLSVLDEHFGGSVDDMSALKRSNSTRSVRSARSQRSTRRGVLRPPPKNDTPAPSVVGEPILGRKMVNKCVKPDPAAKLADFTELSYDRVKFVHRLIKQPIKYRQKLDRDGNYSHLAACICTVWNLKILCYGCDEDIRPSCVASKRQKALFMLDDLSFDEIMSLSTYSTRYNIKYYAV